MSYNQVEKYKTGDHVKVKALGIAKIHCKVEGNYWLKFANGKEGGGWKDRDILGLASAAEFNAEKAHADLYR